MTYYGAYGSNLNHSQMNRRCPNAKLAGTAVLPDWQLEFKLHLTIEPAPGKSVMLGIWEIDRADEASLDYYEGAPYYYEKKKLPVTLIKEDGAKEEIEAMLYIMDCSREYALPTDMYFQVCSTGYSHFGFDPDPLQSALQRVSCRPGVPSYKSCPYLAAIRKQEE